MKYFLIGLLASFVIVGVGLLAVTLAQASDKTPLLYGGWNIEKYQPSHSACHSFGRIFAPGNAKVFATFNNATKAWKLFDYNAPPALNSLPHLCPGDLVVIYVDTEIGKPDGVWYQ